MGKKVFVTGANGMLADSLCPLLTQAGYIVYPSDIITGEAIPELDVRNIDEIKNAASRYRPDIIFHLAAETDVDKCELEPEHAFRTNAMGTENVAKVCKGIDIPMVYISTGAVFDGNKMDGYTENEIPSPLSVYGKSKLEGEQIVKSLLHRYFIVRASWMIGGYNKDKKFVWKIIQRMKKEKKIPVVIDKCGSPTFTKDFAKGLVSIVLKGEYGLYHCVNKGICTRFDIAKKVLEYLNIRDIELKPVTSEAFPLPAPRGKSEALLNDHMSRLGINNMRHWHDALKEYIKDIK